MIAAVIAVNRSGRESQLCSWDSVDHYSSAPLGRITARPNLSRSVSRLRAFDALRAAGKPVGVNAFDPIAAQRYVDAGASFLLVGADVALLTRGSEALAARFVALDAPERGSY